MTGAEFLGQLRAGVFDGCDDVAIQRLIGITVLLG